MEAKIEKITVTIKGVRQIKVESLARQQQSALNTMTKKLEEAKKVLTETMKAKNDLDDFPTKTTDAFLQLQNPDITKDDRIVILNNLYTGMWKSIEKTRGFFIERLIARAHNDNVSQANAMFDRAEQWQKRICTMHRDAMLDNVDKFTVTNGNVDIIESQIEVAEDTIGHIQWLPNKWNFQLIRLHMLIIQIELMRLKHYISDGDEYDKLQYEKATVDSATFETLHSDCNNIITSLDQPVDPHNMVVSLLCNEYTTHLETLLAATKCTLTAEKFA